MNPVIVEGLPLAPIEAHKSFRNSFPAFMAARDAPVGD